MTSASSRQRRRRQVGWSVARSRTAIVPAVRQRYAMPGEGARMLDENADDQQGEQAGQAEHGKLAAEARRAASLAKMRARFDAVADRFQRVYGLRLPQTMAVFAAFWDSLDDTERKGMDYAGLSPGGITAYFEDGGLDLVARD